MKLEQIITEVIIPMGEHKAIFSTCRAKIRVGDQGGGPYLLVEGCNDEPDTGGGETGHEFFLQTMDEIDQFAEICRGILTTAQAVEAAQKDCA